MIKQQTIISYIDAMLLDAIQSSPHTTPTKNQNKTLHKYRRYMERKWAFGRHAEYEAKMGMDEDEAETDEDEAEVKAETREDRVEAEGGFKEGDIVDVVMIDGRVVMKKSQMG